MKFKGIFCNFLCKPRVREFAVRYGLGVPVNSKRGLNENYSLVLFLTLYNYGMRTLGNYTKVAESR